MRRFNYKIDALLYNPPINSSDMEPRYWVKITHIIADHYEKYDGFVLLHGTDTMAYTASALSFMLENLGKPVIITGSQLPIGQLRTDGKENLLTGIEIAAATDGEGNPRVPEVCIFFESRRHAWQPYYQNQLRGVQCLPFVQPQLAGTRRYSIKYDNHLIRPRPDVALQTALSARQQCHDYDTLPRHPQRSGRHLLQRCGVACRGSQNLRRWKRTAKAVVRQRIKRPFDNGSS